MKRHSHWPSRSRQRHVLKKSLDEVWPEIRPVARNEWTGRESNLLNHVLRTGSQLMYEKTIDEVMCQRIYGALSRLSYGAVIRIKVAPVGFEPTTSGS
jgi:hypothetical protein